MALGFRVSSVRVKYFRGVGLHSEVRLCGHMQSGT